MKEEFCGACLAVPLALVGAGVSTAGSSKSTKGKHKKLKKTLLFGGLISIFISILLIIYYKYIKKCNECR